MRTAIDPYIPRRLGVLNIGGALAFIIAVVPFHEIGFAMRLGTEPCQLAGLSRPPQRTRQYLHKRDHP